MIPTLHRGSVLVFGRAPYILGYALAGHLLQFLALQPGKVAIRLHSTPLNLSTEVGRLHALVASIHCYKAAASLVSTLPLGMTIALFQTVQRANNTTIMATEVAIGIGDWILGVTAATVLADNGILQLKEFVSFIFSLSL